MRNSVEPEIWKAAQAAIKRYFRHANVDGSRAIEKLCYQTGYIMGYRAGRAAARRKKK